MFVYSKDNIEMIRGCGTASEDHLEELSDKHDSVRFSKVRIVWYMFCLLMAA